MNRFFACLATAVSPAVILAPASSKEIPLDRDDLVITTDAKIRPGTYNLPDAAADGAVRIEGDGITVDFQGVELCGCSPDQVPDSYTGKGIVIRGRDITLRNAKVRGYKVGIYAAGCPGLLIENIDVSGNWQKRLLSTPAAEDGSDWLWPHRNDDNEWVTNYGAGLCIENSDKVTVRRVRARNGQNGIILDAVNDSKIYDNDCSFLSGWGLAMWRSNRNVISRNAFDFCVRGYSHGVYNRGQDSAGILMFEQNSDNVLAENSATHGGDGFFGFAGLEALGDAPPPSDDFDYERRGNNDNLLINNDFSYAAAHGIEMTFSFGNNFIGNRLVDNSICGVWGGYSQETLIAGNLFEKNGQLGYGLERGGINIEHGTGNVFQHNTFKENKCGVHLWWDPDTGFLEKPWAKANSTASTNNTIAHNTFEGDQVALHIRESTKTRMVSNTMRGVGKEVDADPKSDIEFTQEPARPWTPPSYTAYGDTRPVGARKHLCGREHIIITEWGPYNFTDVAVHPAMASGGRQVTFQVLGSSGRFAVTKVNGAVTVSPKKGDLPGLITVSTSDPGLHPFRLDIEMNGTRRDARGTLLLAEWGVKFFKWEPVDDPREHQDKWDALIAGPPLDQRKTEAIDFKWGGGGPGRDVPADHFGTVATTTLPLPAGTYKVHTVSDDGIRVWVDEERVIDDWTWHPPKEHTATVTLEAGKHHFRIEHFEIDGWAQLQFDLEPAP